METAQWAWGRQLLVKQAEGPRFKPQPLCLGDQGCTKGAKDLRLVERRQLPTFPRGESSGGRPTALPILCVRGLARGKAANRCRQAELFLLSQFLLPGCFLPAEVISVHEAFFIKTIFPPPPGRVFCDEEKRCVPRPELRHWWGGRVSLAPIHGELVCKVNHSSQSPASHREE